MEEARTVLYREGVVASLPSTDPTRPAFLPRTSPPCLQDLQALFRGSAPAGRKEATPLSFAGMPLARSEASLFSYEVAPTDMIFGKPQCRLYSDSEADELRSCYTPRRDARASSASGEGA